MSPRPRNIADHHVAELELQPITPQQTMEKNIVDLDQKKKKIYAQLKNMTTPNNPFSNLIETPKVAETSPTTNPSPAENTG